MQCPKCRSEDITYLPWIGQLWECKKCGYRGPLVLEINERALQLLLRKIPKGKVTTYKILAEKLKLHPRAIAKLLSKNKHPDKYPCYKVVHSDGSIGGYIKGQKEKIRRLKKDGIEINISKAEKNKISALQKFKKTKYRKNSKKIKIDLKKYLFNFS